MTNKNTEIHIATNAKMFPSHSIYLPSILLKYSENACDWKEINTWKEYFLTFKTSLGVELSHSHFDWILNVIEQEDTA